MYNIHVITRAMDVVYLLQEINVRRYCIPRYVGQSNAFFVSILCF